jgi:hypothetical protein
LHLIVYVEYNLEPASGEKRNLQAFGNA